MKILKGREPPFLLWWTLALADSPYLLMVETWRPLVCRVIFMLFYFFIVSLFQNLPVGPSSGDKTAGTWEVARASSRLSHFIANPDTSEKGNPRFKWTISITSENCFHAFELSGGKEHIHNNLHLIYHLFNACLAEPFGNHQKVM